MTRSLSFVFVLLFASPALIATGTGYARQPSLDEAGGQNAGQMTGQSAVTPESQPTIAAQTFTTGNHRDAALLRDVDMLRRDDFEKADRVTVTVRVRDVHNNPTMGLEAGDFLLTVNGSMRKARLMKESVTATVTEKPMVLLVFPPNQPVIHLIAVRDCVHYFTGVSFMGTSADVLPWRVGILDANGDFTSFTDERSVLLSNLEAVRTAREPMQVSSDRFLSKGQNWDGGWLAKANNAITDMQREPGAKLIMAMNPLGEPAPASLSQGRDAPPLVDGGPSSLTPIAQAVGAHIYIANVGGPDPIIPGGDAGETAATWGTRPSMNQRISPAQTAALNYYAAANSRMLLTAEATLGGASNSIAELAGQMQRDLDSAYHLEFDMTPEDQDTGIPEISVGMKRPSLRAAIMDVAPITTGNETAQRKQSQARAHTLLASLSKPIASKDFSIDQRVDYFPVRGGLEPVLPMSCLVAWHGRGEHPEEIVLVESVVDRDLDAPVLERTLDTRWESRGLSWERDGQLRPGRYIWRVAVAQTDGRILASAQQNVTVAFPRNPPVAVSSLVIGNACKTQASANGLKKRPIGKTSAAAIRLTVDPLQLGDCRFVPEADGQFKKSDTLHALVRIYPDAKLEKNRPEAWSAQFSLRSADGTVRLQQQMPFDVDSGSGLFAAVTMLLDTAGIATGNYRLEVVIDGPGLKKPLEQTEVLMVSP